MAFPVARVGFAVMVLVGLGPAAFVAISAQNETMLRCAGALTADEIQKAVGEAFQSVGAENRNGASECLWIARTAKGAKSVSLQFYDKASIAETPSKTIEAFFKVMSEPSDVAKMAPMPGVGVRAVFVTADPQKGAYVQLADGVARIVTNNLTPEQVVAVARAVATP